MSIRLSASRTSANVGSTFGGTTLISSNTATTGIGNFEQGVHIERIYLAQASTVLTTAWTIFRYSIAGGAGTTLALFSGGGSSVGEAVSVEIKVDLDNVSGYDFLNGSTEMVVHVYGG